MNGLDEVDALIASIAGEGALDLIRGAGARARPGRRPGAGGKSRARARASEGPPGGPGAPPEDPGDGSPLETGGPLLHEDISPSILADINHALFPSRYYLEVHRWRPDPWQVDMLDSQDRGILLCCSRQSGKTEAVARLVYHRARFVPGSLSVIVAPSLRQASLLFSRVQRAWEGDPARLRVVEGGQTRMKMENGSEIEALPGTERTTRGYAKVDLLVIDEAAQALDELYYAMRPVLAVSKGRTVLLSTPRGKRGFFYREWVGGARDEGEVFGLRDGWKRIKVTADQCPRISREFLEEERAKLPVEWYLQEYYCKFLDTQGQVFATDMVQAAFDERVVPLFSGTPLSEEVEAIEV